MGGCRSRFANSGTTEAGNSYCTCGLLAPMTAGNSFGASGLETVRGLGFAVNTPCGVTLDRDGCTAPRSSGHSTFPSGYGGFGLQTCIPPAAEERHVMCCDMDSTQATIQQALQYQGRHHLLGGETSGPVWPGPWLHRRARSKLRDLKCSRICGSCSD